MSFIIYSELDHRQLEFRLLRLLAMSDFKYKFIPECYVIHGYLKQKPQYTALSYQWGNPEQNRVIIVNGAPVRVPKNLYEALMAMRPSQGEILIWIDFLCINQHDDMEKSAQVALMSTIYSQASQVFIWLGPTENESASTIAYLDTFGKQAELCGFEINPRIADTLWQELAFARSDTIWQGPIPLFSILSALNNPAQTPHCFSRFLLHLLGQIYRLSNLFYLISGWHSKPQQLSVQGILDLFKRGWWGRVWVLQETALAKRAEFVCGSSRISRNRLCAAINAYHAFRTAILGEIKNLRIDGMSRYHLHVALNFQYRPQVMLNAHRIYQERQFPLIALLPLTCVGSVNLSRHGPHHLESTDPRDKIFALLSIASDQEELGAKGLLPDYTKSCQEVYTLTASIMLEQGYISLLSYVQYPKGVEGLPSWVPDWSKSITAPLQILKDDHLTMEPRFNASGALKYTTCRPNNQPKELLWENGITFDRIHQIGYFPRRSSSSEVPLLETFSWAQEWLVEILRLTYSVQRPYATFAERLQAVVRVSVGGAAYEDQRDQLCRVGNSRFVDGVFLLQNGPKRIRNQIFERECQDFLIDFISEHKQRFRGMNWKSLRLIQEINGRSLRRVPFITKKGYLGLSSDRIRVADQTVIIKGAELPYILRKRQSGFHQLISEAYIEGAMDGELAAESNFIPLPLE